MTVAVAMTVVAACSSGDSTTAPTAPATTTPPTTSPTTPTTPTSQGAPVDCIGPLDGPDTQRYRSDVADSTPDLVSLDVYRRPGATGCPVIIWVHGGGWRDGDKVGRAIETKRAFAGELGAVLVSVNYRLVTPVGDVRWPLMGDDVAAAVAWVFDHATELGVDPQRVALMGHSAGAHLVSIVATNPPLLEGFGASRADLRCVVSLDTAAFLIADDDRSASPLFLAAFGDDPTTLADASPTVQAQEHPEGIPDFLVVTRGSPARVAESEDFAAAVSAGGAQAQVVDADGYTHNEVNTELGVPGELVVTPPTRDFLQACFD